jgi:hypothetical protein
MVPHMSLTTDQLRTALSLVDEMLDCSAQLHDNMGSGHRELLESALAERAARVKDYLDLGTFATGNTRVTLL